MSDPTEADEDRPLADPEEIEEFGAEIDAIRSA